MSRFAAVLQRIDELLDLPEPARSRLLLEIAADLEDAYDLYRARGLPDAEARREAIESFDLSAETLTELARVHCGPVRRALDHLSSDALRLWERILLLALFGAAVQAGGWLTRGDRVFRDAGPFAWPIVLAAAVALTVAVVQFYRLFLKQDHRPRRRRGQLGLMPGLAVLMVFLGFTGSWIEVWRLAADAARINASPVVSMMQWALRSTALLQVSLGLALLSALVWFGLARKVSRIERYEAELLFRDR